MEKKNLNKHQFWLKFSNFVELYVSTASIDKKFANEYVHIIHIQCHLSVVNIMTLNNTGVFQCHSVIRIFIEYYLYADMLRIL